MNTMALFANEFYIMSEVKWMALLLGMVIVTVIVAVSATHYRVRQREGMQKVLDYLLQFLTIADDQVRKSIGGELSDLRFREYLHPRIQAYVSAILVQVGAKYVKCIEHELKVVRTELWSAKYDDSSVNFLGVLHKWQSLRHPSQYLDDGTYLRLLGDIRTDALNWQMHHMTKAGIVAMIALEEAELLFKMKNDGPRFEEACKTADTLLILRPKVEELRLRALQSVA